MIRRPEEARTWPETEGEDALSALREGLERLRSGVAVFREMIQPDSRPNGREEAAAESEDRA